MVKKPPCRICRSKKWRKNSLGFYICEFGHQLEGHQEEEGEFDASLGSMHRRQLRGPKRKRKTKKAQHYYGANAEDLLLQAMQLILRKQLYALVHDLGFPPEIEQVAQEYWTLYISCQKTYQDTSKPTTEPAYSRNVEESETGNTDDREPDDEETHLTPEGGDTLATRSAKRTNQSTFRDKTKVPGKDPDELDKLEVFQNDNSEHSNSSEDDSEIDSDQELQTGDNDDVESNEDERGGDPSTERRAKCPADEDPRRLNIGFTVAICYLAAVHLQLPVTMGDFNRWAMDRRLPYFNAMQHLPADMKLKVPFPGALRPNSFGLYPDMPNIPLLIFRFTQELMLPIEVYPCALRLSQILFEIKTPSAGQPESSLDIYHFRHRTVKGPTIAMALVIVVAKMFFGLDGKNREFEELIQVNPDLYSEYFKEEVMPVSKPEFGDLLTAFETTEYAQKAGECSYKQDISPGIEAFIRNLHSGVAPPESSRDDGGLEPPPLRPGEGYVLYRNDNEGVYLGNYARVLSHASNVLYLNPELLQREVRRIEESLLLTERNSNAHQFAKQEFTIPESHDTLQRIDYDKVSREEFIEQFEEKYLPVVIRGVTEDWGSCKNWNSETFLKKYYSQPFKVGEDDDGNNVYVKMKYFLKYAETDGLKDDSPLYIFDSGFVKRKLTPVQKRRITGSGSSSSSSSSSERKLKRSPKSKEESSSSGDEAGAVGSKRARSGSKSPTATSRKIIRVFGKRVSPGASDSTNSRSGSTEASKERVSKREEEHASTLLNDYMVPKYFKDDLFHVYDPPMKPFDREAVSWFHHVYPRFVENDFELGKKYGMIQVIQGPGETMFVPGGWPHIVMNLDFTIAITQNFCSPTNFESVWLNTRHARPKLAKKLQSEIERLHVKTGRCFYKDLLDKCRSLAYVPMLRMSTDDSSSSSSSSSDSSDDMSSTESESDIGEICMCHKCKKKRRKEARRASKEGKTDKSD
ncbi:jumonji domain-containing protein 6 [Dissophora ornata]|nr:jumonji domain-containing protein 6 [Dissophora ornata]